MGNITGNSEVINHGPDNLFIGNNEFASGVLTLSAGATAKDGYVLARNSSSGKLEMVPDVNGQCFILASRDNLVNKGSAAMDFNVRVCIAGRVKRSCVSVAGSPLTDTQADNLRASGILALDITSIGKQDNQ